MPILYVTGDATDPIMDRGHRYHVICHICNDIGAWGAGFVMALSKKWPGPERDYRNWSCRRNDPSCSPSFALGSIQIVNVCGKLYVVNMIAQEGIDWQDGIPPIRYKALGQCLSKLNDLISSEDTWIHMPRIGCGLAGGEWSKVEKLINKWILNQVFVYDLPEE